MTRELSVHHGAIAESIYESSIAAHAEKIFGAGSAVIERQGTLESGRRFDLLVSDGVDDTGQTVILIEVKARTAKAEDVAQLLAYMGELQASTPWSISGVLAAPSATERCAYALGAAGCSFLSLTPVIEFDLMPANGKRPQRGPLLPALFGGGNA